jgi:hypothetical protein
MRALFSPPTRARSAWRGGGGGGGAALRRKKALPLRAKISARRVAPPTRPHFAFGYAGPPSPPPGFGGAQERNLKAI